MKNTSTVVVALPAEDDGVHGFGPEQKHATLLWFGELDSDAAVQSAVQSLAAQLKPFSVEVQSAGQLGDDEPRAEVLFLDSNVQPLGPSLAGVREELLNDEQVRELWSSVRQYPKFTAHVTLGYGQSQVPKSTVSSALDSVKEIAFDRLAVWHGDEQTEYPLGDAALETTMVAAGGVRIVRTQEGAKRFGVPIGSEIRVDGKGRVVSVKKSKASLSTPKAAAPAKPPRPDPNRKPTKFVSTAPGQKAKLVLDASPVKTTGSQPKPVVAQPKTPSLPADSVKTLTDTKSLSKYVKISPKANAAIKKLNSGRPLSAQDRSSLRTMVAQAIRKLHAEIRRLEGPSSSSSSRSDSGKSKSGSERSEKQKQATKKAQDASSKSTSSAKKAAQAKAQQAATRMSALKRKLEAAYRALGGDPANLTKPKSKSKAKGSKLPTTGFSGMNSKELSSAIRRLSAANRSNPSSRTKSALKRAREVRDRRAKRRAEHDRRIELLSKGDKR